MQVSVELQSWIDENTKGDNAVVGIIETMGTDTQTIYTQYKNQWEEITRGGPVVTVGWLDHRPINIALNLVKINGRRVMLYDPCSQLVDFKMIETYLEKIWPGVPTTNATNAYNVLR